MNFMLLVRLLYLVNLLDIGNQAKNVFLLILKFYVISAKVNDMIARMQLEFV